MIQVLVTNMINFIRSLANSVVSIATPIGVAVSMSPNQCSDRQYFVKPVGFGWLVFSTMFATTAIAEPDSGWQWRGDDVSQVINEAAVAKETSAPDQRQDQPSASPEGRLVEQAADTKLPVNASSAERLHLIAPGDAISLVVFGEPDLSIENVRVPESGRVSLPLIGSVAVKGKTTAQVEQNVAALLSEGYVRNPRLSVTIFSYRPIFIRGAVRSTGAFPYTEGLTVAKAIALAGGSKNSAKRNGITILRDGNTVEKGLSVDSLALVDSGDVITVEEEVGVSEDETAYVYLHGEVAQPGAYVFSRDLTVEKAVVLAGGFSLRASRKKISLTRYVGVEANQEPIRLRRVKLYTPVEPGDIINVGASWF